MVFTIFVASLLAIENHFFYEILFWISFSCQNFTWKKGSAPHHVPWTIEKEPPKKGQSKNKTSLVPPTSHLRDWTSPGYCSLGSASPLKKLIIRFWKKIIFEIFFFHDLLLYCHMRSEILQILACNIYDDFQHLTFKFSPKFIPVF
jgi:hypothetical protein